jgi:LmbE family N-acetylglucosaminyl deacetylase
MGARRILVATAHPDDADIMAGGTVARWVDEGHDVHSVIFTRGDKGHEDPGMTPERVGALREAEQRAAAAILGVSRLTFLDFADGELAWAGPALAETATMLIRQERPDVVVTHDPYGGAPGYREPQLHPDHRAVGLAVVEACHFRGTPTTWSTSRPRSSARCARCAPMPVSSTGIRTSRDSCADWPGAPAAPITCPWRRASSGSACREAQCFSRRSSKGPE